LRPQPADKKDENNRNHQDMQTLKSVFRLFFSDIATAGVLLFFPGLQGRPLCVNIVFLPVFLKLRRISLTGKS
jgi:hypothetical protein